MVHFGGYGEGVYVRSFYSVTLDSWTESNSDMGLFLEESDQAFPRSSNALCHPAALLVLGSPLPFCEVLRDGPGRKLGSCYLRATKIRTRDALTGLDWRSPLSWRDKHIIHILRMCLTIPPLLSCSHQSKPPEQEPSRKCVRFLSFRNTKIPEPQRLTRA